MRSVKNKFLCLALILLFNLLFLSACSGLNLATLNPPTPERPLLKVTWNLWPGNYPLVIAEELGLFEKHGVAVESILSDAYESMGPDFLAGKTDGVLFTWTDALVMDARTPDSARVVLVLDESAGGDVVVATTDITAVADLKGRSIGASAGSFGELLVRHMLQANEMMLDDVTLVDVSPEVVAEAMPEAIQAGFTFEPHTSQALSRGHHIIFTSAEAPGLIADVAIFRTEVVKERPEEIRAFIAAWFEALDYWQQNPEEGNALIAKALNLPPEEISTEGLKLLNLEDNLRAFESGSDTTSLYVSGQINADFLISTGGLTNAPEIERLLDPSFLQ